MKYLNYWENRNWTKFVSSFSNIFFWQILDESFFFLVGGVQKKMFSSLSSIQNFFRSNVENSKTNLCSKKALRKKMLKFSPPRASIKVIISDPFEFWVAREEKFRKFGIFFAKSCLGWVLGFQESFDAHVERIRGGLFVLPYSVQQLSSPILGWLLTPDKYVCQTIVTE